MSYTPSETRILIDYHRQFSREWKDCYDCGIAFKGDGDQCSDCTEFEEEQRAEAERLACLEMERDRLRSELLRYWTKMSYTLLRLKKLRIEEINNILSPSNQ